jgi:choline dehydrogenase
VREPELPESGSGPLTSCIAEAGAFSPNEGGLDAPDLQLHAVPAAYPDEGLGEIVDHGVTLTAAVLTPRGRGRVTLAVGRADGRAAIAERAADLLTV